MLSKDEVSYSHIHISNIETPKDTFQDVIDKRYLTLHVHISSVDITQKDTFEDAIYR